MKWKIKSRKLSKFAVKNDECNWSWYLIKQNLFYEEKLPKIVLLTTKGYGTWIFTRLMAHLMHTVDSQLTKLVVKIKS